MHNKRLFLLGASGHAKVIMEIIEANGKSVSGLFDDNPKIESLLQHDMLGPIDDALKFPGDEFIISIGNNAIRKKIADRLALPYISTVHPAAILSKRSCIDSGTVLMAGVVVNSGTSVGKHAILNTRCSVDHDCVLGDFVHISPGATLAGNVTAGEGAHVGTGACVIPGISIGKWSIIGAGAVIIRDVPDYAVVVGNPGRVLKMLH